MDGLVDDLLEARRKGRIDGFWTFGGVCDFVLGLPPLTPCFVSEPLSSH